MEDNIIYNSIDNTYIVKEKSSFGEICKILNRYGEIVFKNLYIDLNNDDFDLDELIDKYNNVYVILDKLNIDEINKIPNLRRKLSYLNIINCNKMYIDTKLFKLIDKVPKAEIIPVADYRYVNIFKKDLENVININKTDKISNILIYLHNKVLWSDIIYDFKDYTDNLSIIVSEKSLYLSSQVAPFTDIRKIEIMRQLWTTFKINLIIYENRLNYTEKICENEINKVEDDLSISEKDLKENINSDMLGKEESIYDDYFTEEDFKIDYNMIDFPDGNESEDENTPYEYEVEFDEFDDPILKKKEIILKKTENIYWEDIINKFISNTPNMYEINVDSEKCNIYPSKINTVSEYKHNLSNIILIKNGNDESDRYIIYPEVINFIDSLNRYSKSYKSIYNKLNSKE